MSADWARRRWLDFRNGHSIYLVFTMSFTNFILITYNFMPFLKDATSLPVFVVLFLLGYIPLAIALGYWHRKTQWRIEYTLGFKENPLLAKSIRILIDLYQGKATQKELEEMRNLLIDIERSKG